jgi:hypothetical protein
MAVNMGRSSGSTLREQYLTLKVMADNIRSQEQFLMMVDREHIIPDMARRLSKEAISEDLISNKRVFLDFLYNMLARTGPGEPDMDIEFHYLIIDKGFFEVDKSILWMQENEVAIPFEIGDRLGKTIVGEEAVDAVRKIIAFYKEAEARFDREHFGDLDRCSLLVLEEHFPQSSWHIRMRLPAKILNDHPISI